MYLPENWYTYWYGKLRKDHLKKKSQNSKLILHETDHNGGPFFNSLLFTDDLV